MFYFLHPIWSHNATGPWHICFGFSGRPLKLQDSEGPYIPWYVQHVQYCLMSPVDPNLKNYGEFQRTRFPWCSPLIHITSNEKVTLWKLWGVGWILYWFMASLRTMRLRTLPLPQCFCITSGTHLYWLTKQRLPRSYWERSYLSNWSTAWRTAQVQWKA